MPWKLALGVVILLGCAVGGLAVYGARQTPEQRTFEQVLPDERFPN